MRLTAVLQAQHIGNAFKKVWKVQSNRKILDFGVREQLESKKKVQVVDALEFLGLKPATVPPQTFNIETPKSLDGAIDDSLLPKPITNDKSHPDWHNQECSIYDEYSSLVAGLDQGLNLTKTILAGRELPERINATKHENLSDEIHNKVQQAILNAHLLDAIQEKLPRDVHKNKQYGRVYPREYGLPKWRRNQQLLTKLFYICDTTLASQGELNMTKTEFSTEVIVKAPLTIDGQPILFDLKSPQLLFCRKGLEPYVNEASKTQLLSQPLPNLYPLARTIHIHKKNIYRSEHKFPLRQGAPFDRLNMVVFHFNKPFIKENDNQQLGRLLVHTFGVAAAYAKRLYGKDVIDLPEPLTINAIQTDSRNFSYGCLQLHSLNLDGDDAAARNVAWLQEPQSLFLKCDYVDGKPVLEGYNPKVFETLMAVYSSSISS